MSAAPLRAPERSRPQAASGYKLQRLAEPARSRQGTETAQDRARSPGEILVICTGGHAAAATAGPR